MVTPLFDAERIAEETFVKRVEVHDELPSTNDRAIELALGDAPFPALVIAERQSAGRGRGNNRWWSRAGALTFSLVLDADEMRLPPALWPRLSLTAGLSVCQALEDLLRDHEVAPGDHLGLKWPNDVHLQGRKVCGILVEVPPRPGRRLVVGIGVNVNNELSQAPPELRASAVSLGEWAGLRFQQLDVLLKILTQFERDLNDLRSGDESLSRRWQTRCVLRGHTVTLNTGGHEPVGTCEGIDDSGALILHTPAGRQRFLAGVATRIVNDE